MALLVNDRDSTERLIVRVVPSNAMVAISSRDSWCKGLENHQTHWAPVDQTSGNGTCAALFFHELSGDIDRMSFPNLAKAEKALRFNRFDRLVEVDERGAAIAPRPPVYEDTHLSGLIHSSGQFRRSPDRYED